MPTRRSPRRWNWLQPAPRAALALLVVAALAQLAAWLSAPLRWPVGVLNLLLAAFLVRWIQVLHRSNRKLRVRPEESEEAVAECLACQECRQILKHDFSNPANVILGFASLLDAEVQGTLNHKQKDYVRHILAATRQVESLAASLSAESKGWNGRCAHSPQNR